MSARVNRQVVLVSRPDGIPQADCFRIIESEIRDPDPGEILVRNEYLSVDPAMRGWVSAVVNYSEPVPIGGVMRAPAVGRVVASGSAEFTPGQRVMGWFGWQEWATVPATSVSRRLHDDGMPPSLALGVLGLTGATGWFAMTEVGKPQRGDTVVVSTAAGAVGSVAGQVARLAGCRTVGIAGGADKVRMCLDEFGYDAAIDYRSESFEAELATALPQGVDVYFDNTGGRISDAVVTHINHHARIVICGTASVATWDPWPVGPVVTRRLLTKAARMEGFLFFDYEDRLDEAVARLAELIASGDLRHREEVLIGIETAPDAIAGLYRGENLGKRVIRVH